MLAVVALFAFLLRVPSYDWDQGHDLHPDEVLSAQVALNRVYLGAPLSRMRDPHQSPMNPRGDGLTYPYGALPLYATKVAIVLSDSFQPAGYVRTQTDIIHTGRILAGLFDVATTLLVFFTGYVLWGRGAGLLAAALYAFAMLPIQISHFYTPEPFMTTFMTAALLCSVLLFRRRAGRLAFLAGVCGGLAMACKISALPVLALPIAAVLLWLLPGEGRERDWRRVVGFAGLVLGGAFLGLFVGDPFAVLDAPAYLAQVAQQADIQRGVTDVWFTRSYVVTWPVLYPLWQLLLLGAGPAAGLAGALGAGVLAFRAWAGRRAEWALLLAGALVYFASIAFLEAKWVRYLVPLVPYVCLFAAFVVLVRKRELGVGGHPPTPGQGSAPVNPRADSVEYAGRYPQATGQGSAPANSLRYGVAAALVLLTVLPALAFSAIYGAENSRVKASEWVYANVPPGSSIAHELNDAALPLSLPGHETPGQEYRLLDLRMLGDQSSGQVLDMLRSTLSQAGYLVVAGGRVMHTVPELPWRYPVQNRYYDLLFGGQLGYTLVYTAAAYPTLFGLQIRDDTGWADVSFFENDHPPVHVFKKERDLSEEEWSSLFARAVARASVPSRTAP